MKVIELLETGGPEVLQLREMPIPTPGDGQVLIHVAASGVNFIGSAGGDVPPFDLIRLASPALCTLHARF